MNSFDIASISIPPTSVWIIFTIMIVYVVTITLFGGYFARFNSNINDFFYSGQRFSWWLPAMSMIATGIGSYSYLKYSEQGYNTGMSSSLGYLNDWFIVPFFMFGWLPIIYFSKVKSIPEYFERRFNRTARYVALFTILCYMFYYIGYNLYTIGIAFEGMFGFPSAYTVPLVALFLGFYVTFAGQTGVIFTDLFQAFMLFLAGGIAIFSGLYMLGGLDEFWSWLPPSHRVPFPHLTDNPYWNTTGLFWGDALAMSIAFTYMNQGFIMRYLTIKSIRETKKAILFNIMVSLPLAAVTVGGVGWIAKAIMTKQNALGAFPGYNLIEIENTFHTFLIVCWEAIKHNAWIFGFVIAALMAALMSTIDTLINACAAVGIYDIYKPLIKPKASARHYLKAARWASIIATLIGALLVIWFHGQKGTLMSIHYQGIMTIIPPIVVTIFMGMLWSRFHATAACIAMILGSGLTLMTNIFPEWITPLAQFVMVPENDKYIYMRALFGMAGTACIGVAATLLLSSPKRQKNITGLTMFSLDEAMEKYKGGKPNHKPGQKVKELKMKLLKGVPQKYVELHPTVLKKLEAKPEDLLYVCDNRWWLGGLRSEHMKVSSNSQLKEDEIALSKDTMKMAYFLPEKTLCVEKIF